MVPIVEEEAMLATGLVEWVTKISLPLGFDPQTVKPVVSLYRVHNPGPKLLKVGTYAQV